MFFMEVCMYHGSAVKTAVAGAAITIACSLPPVALATVIGGAVLVAGIKVFSVVHGKVIHGDTTVEVSGKK
jgi:hypothetical protein